VGLKLDTHSGGMRVEVVPAFVDPLHAFASLLGFQSAFAPFLALQLAGVLSGRAGHVTLCDGCGRPYLPRRLPRPRTRHFCDDCWGVNVPARLRMRDYLARKRRRGEAGDGGQA